MGLNRKRRQHNSAISFAGGGDGVSIRGILKRLFSEIQLDLYALWFEFRWVPDTEGITKINVHSMMIDTVRRMAVGLLKALQSLEHP